MLSTDQNIILTLNMLVAHCRQQKVFKNVWTPEQLHTLHITKEHVADAGLTIPVFLNTLEEIAKKGYLSNTPIIDQKYRNQLADTIAGNYDAEIKELLSKVDTPEVQQKLKAGIATIFKNTTPHDHEFDEEGFRASKITLEDLVNGGLQVVRDTTDLVAVVVLMPFRSIERLLSQMNSGIAFNDVKDPGLWYNPESFTLHFNDKQYSTKYRNDATKAHYVLQGLFNNPTITYFYDDIRDAEAPRKYFDSLLHFIKKNPELDSVFAITTGSIEIKPEYIDHVH